MSVQTLSFGSDLLADTGKKGILSPMADGSGYYMMNAGCLNAPLRLGHHYAINDYIMECMNPDSDLKRRLSRGEVYAELGHPGPFYVERVNGLIVRTPMVEAFEFVMRLRTIVPENVCLHVREIHFDFINKASPIKLRAEIIPFGPLKQTAEDSLLNPSINTALSMRTVTKPQVPGQPRQIEYFTGVDLVWEPGEGTACKYLTAGLEDFMTNSMEFGQAQRLEITVEHIVETWEAKKKDPLILSRFAGNEDFDGMDALIRRLAQTNKASKKVEMINMGAYSLF